MMKSPFILFFCSLALAAEISQAQSVDSAKVHELTVKGIDQLYNLDMDESEKTFDEIVQMAPGDPRGHFFKGMVHFWLYSFTREEKEYETWIEYSDKVIKICEDILDKNDDDAVAKFYLGGAYGFRGVAHWNHGSLLKSVWDGKKGYGYLKEAIAKNPELYDAHMGFGLFNYAISRIPKAFRWVLNLLGFDGDREGGLNSLRLAAEKGTYTRTEASIYLANFLFSEQKQDEAFKFLNYLLQRHPENTLFLIMNANWQFRLSHFDSAQAACQRAIRINNRKKVRYGEESAYSILASIYFANNDFVDARTNLEMYIQKTENKNNIANWTYYRLATCNELLGDRAKAIEWYRKMKKVEDKDRASDTYYYRKGAERIRRPMDEWDVLMLKADNDFTGKNYDAALQKYSDASNKSNGNPNRQAASLYGLVQTYYEKEHFSEVINVSNQLLALSPPQEKWYIPHGYFKLGQAYAKLGKTAEARRAFKTIDDYDNYDFQQSLETRVEEELKKLNAGS